MALIIDSDSVESARELFPGIDWTTIPYSDLDPCGVCPDLDGDPADAVAVVVDDKWGFERRTTVCAACLHLELGYLIRAAKVPPSFIEVRLLREPVTYAIGVAA